MNNGFTYHEASYQRPFLFIEDRAKDAEAFCEALSGASRELPRQSTVLLLDEPGRDTWITAMKLMLRYQGIRVVTPYYEEGLKNQLSRINAKFRGAGRSFNSDADELLGKYPEDEIKTMVGRYEDLDPKALVDQQTFIDAIDRRLRRGGICICDVELPSLKFEFGSKQTERFRGVHAAGEVCQTKGAKLVILSGVRDFGVDPEQDFQDLHIKVSKRCQKDKGLAAAADFLRDGICKRFRWKLRMRFEEGLVESPIGTEDVARVEETADLVIHPVKNGRFTLSGKAVPRPTEIQEGSGRGRVFRRLVEDKLAGPSRDVLSNSEIEAMLKDAARERQAGQGGDDWTPAQVIYQIRALLHKERRFEVVPRGGDGYGLGEDAVVAIIEKEEGY